MTGQERERINNAARVIVYAGLFYFTVHSIYLIGGF